MPAVSAAVGVASTAMEVVGLKKPATGPIDVDLSIQAGNNLNLSQGQPMALVAKIYYLQDIDSFQRMPLAMLAAADSTPGATLPGVLATREITLTPGQRYVSVEKVPREAAAVGIAALFHTPAPGRWKYAFPLDAASKSGIVLGAHACALSVSTGAPAQLAGAPARDPARVGDVRCDG